MPSEVITEAQSDQSLRCALYGYLVRASSNNCVQITQIDMLIQNFAWRTFDFFFKELMCLNKSIAIYYVFPVLTLYIFDMILQKYYQKSVVRFNISISLSWKCLIIRIIRNGGQM